MQFWNKYRSAIILFSLAWMTVGAHVLALEPPTRKQLDKYRQDGSLSRRIEAAKALGNHLPDPWLVKQLSERLGLTQPDTPGEARVES